MASGAAIRRAREELGWTQAELAERAGFSQPYVSRIEGGHVDPPIELLILLGLREPEAPRRPPPRREPAPAPASLWRAPLVSGEFGEEVRRWQRPESSGDAFLALQLPRGDLLMVAFDVAGHGVEQVPKLTYLQGWLRGRTRDLSIAPRLESLSDDLQRELKSVGLQVAWYMGLLSPDAETPHRFAYQGAARRFPAPLLLVGAPPSTLPAAGSSGEVARHEFFAPWRLCVASDGLLRRLGKGDERRGKEVLLEWQVGESREAPPADWLDTKAPLVDDELFAAVSWDRWDGSLSFSIHDDATRHRAKRLLEQELSMDPSARLSFIVAVSEVLANVRCHAYGGGDGPVEVSWRNEGERVRVQVDDFGRGRPPFRESGGYAAMRAHADEVDVVRLFPAGTRVSLSKKKESAND